MFHLLFIRVIVLPANCKALAAKLACSSALAFFMYLLISFLIIMESIALISVENLVHYEQKLLLVSSPSPALSPVVSSLSVLYTTPGSHVA
ncbi:uncharacterized protein G2W53_028792 [Senna tora]|uniref:Uncharacterized protein n=1 Tax=Senna tora TaxID=362788 RepID=A0A834T1M8_9FABA|nr:uncharacterized protein G2W53_028792 [Senna tora]